MDRRTFLRMTGIGAAGALTGGLTSLLAAPPLGAATGQQGGFTPDLEIDLTARPADIPIMPGTPTRSWVYRGKVTRGDSNSLIPVGNSYLGPTFRVKTGQKVRVRFTNQIPDESIVHWHGLHVPAVMDGHPRYVIGQGKTYLYEFEVNNRAGTYWYHPHPHGRTGPQAYGGMAGLFLVSDDEETAAGLPDGEFDIPLVLQDRTFDANNQLVYLGSMGGMMGRMNGFLGQWIMVNGQPRFTLPVATRPYRLRLLNGSNSRIYKLAWQDGRPLTVIGTDGGLLQKPVHRRYVMLAPGERLELWADFSKDPLDSQTALVSLPFDGGMMGRGGMMGGGGNFLPNGAAFTICKIHVRRRESATSPLPRRLSKIKRYRPGEAANAGRPRTFYLQMRHMAWTINGRTFEMTAVAPDETVRLGTMELWEFVNQGGGMGMMGGMGMPHPMHLHGKQFQVLERRGVAHEGYVDEGWKDTVLVMPGERIRFLVRFDDYPGLFLYHCHNLEHEDMGMMRNFEIVA
jgi:FtsP/CotA-like multicopper oxidase with cupredoxin domain